MSMGKLSDEKLKQFRGMCELPSMNGQGLCPLIDHIDALKADLTGTQEEFDAVSAMVDSRNEEIKGLRDTLHQLSLSASPKVRLHISKALQESK